MDNGLPLGFSGNSRDSVTGAYPLGNGYRAYLAHLMRFNAPDDWSPFGAGLVNPYAYCGDDPIGNADPSGHAFMSTVSAIETEAATGIGEIAAEAGEDLPIPADRAVSASQHAGDGAASGATAGPAGEKTGLKSALRSGAAQRRGHVAFAKGKAIREVRSIDDDEYDDRTPYPKKSWAFGSKLLRAKSKLNREEVDAEVRKFVDYAEMQLQIADERIEQVNTLLKNRFRGNLKTQFATADIALKDARFAVDEAAYVRSSSTYYIDTALEHDVFALQDRYKKTARLLPKGPFRLWRRFKARYL